MIAGWKIVLEPKADDDWRGGGVLEILSYGSSEEDAIEALEGWAETIQRTGRVPSSMDWQNQSPAHVGTRAGRLRFHARVDSFEHDTENGYNNGGAWLVARSFPEDEQ